MQSAAHAQASAAARHAGLLHRLGGRPIASPAAIDLQARRSVQSRVLLKILARRG